MFQPNVLFWCVHEFIFIFGSLGPYRKRWEKDEGGKEKVEEKVKAEKGRGKESFKRRQAGRKE